MIYDVRKYNLVAPYKDFVISGQKEFHRFTRFMAAGFPIKVVSKVKYAKIFPIDILFYNDFCRTVDLYKMMGSKVIRKLSRGKGVLVFHFAHEAFHPGNEEALYDPFKKYVLPQLKKLSIPIKNTYWITGDLKTHTLHNDGVEDMNFLGLDVFGELVSTRTRYSIDGDYFSNSTKFNLDKPIDFLYLNGCPRPTKCILKYHLEEEGLLSKTKSIYSWLHRHQKPDANSIENIITKYSVRYNNSLADILKSANKLNILDATHSSIGKKQDLFPKSFIENTCVNLVPETSVIEPMFFITEKTYKTILFKHPFVLWGNPFMLKYLRSLGYITFSNIFDETYDSIQHTPKSDKNFNLNCSMDYKMEIISNNLKTFRERAIGKEKAVNEILSHNRNLLIDNPVRQRNINTLSVILERVESL